MVLAVMIFLTVWRVIAVNHAQSQVSSLNQQLNVINNVEIPKYDKAVALKASVLAQQAALKPLVAERGGLADRAESDFYLPAHLVDTFFARPDRISDHHQHDDHTSSDRYIPSLATATAEVATSSVSGVTAWGTSMSQSPAFTNVIASGNLAQSQSGTVQFNGTWSINSTAVSGRSSLFSRPVP